MRNAQSENIDQPVISALNASPFSWKHIAQLTLLAMAAGLLLLGSRCHALTTSADTNRPSIATQAPSQSAVDAGGPMTSATARARVVRLSDVEGTVQIVRNNQTEFSHAVMNMPLTQGSRIETGPDGRAEIEFEDGSVTRITPNSSLNLAKLDIASDGALETTLEQASGLVYYELRSDSRSAFTVIFGESKVAPTVNSTFRVNLASLPAALAVIDGRVQVNGISSDYTAEVPQGKAIEFQPSNGAQYTIADGMIPNGFDDWNDQRDEEAAKQAENQTAARVQQGGGSIMDGGLVSAGAIWTPTADGIRSPVMAWFGSRTGSGRALIPTVLVTGQILADSVFRGFQDIRGVGFRFDVVAGPISVVSAGDGHPAVADLAASPMAVSAATGLDAEAIVTRTSTQVPQGTMRRSHRLICGQACMAVNLGRI